MFKHVYKYIELTKPNLAEPNLAEPNLAELNIKSPQLNYNNPSEPKLS